MTGGDHDHCNGVHSCEEIEQWRNRVLAEIEISLDRDAKRSVAIMNLDKAIKERDEAVKEMTYYKRQIDAIRNSKPEKEGT